MKTSKKLLMLLLAMVLLVALAVCVAPAASAKVQPGDVIEFGTYPQTQVTDTALIAQLDSFSANYPAKSYGYKYNDSKTLDMVYKDFFYQTVKYRGVKIGQWRPIDMGSDPKAGESHQDESGFELNKWYYFKYEPLTWTVIDTNTGLVVCNNVIDAQAFHNKDNTKELPFEDTTLDAFLWGDFYETAFTEGQQAYSHGLTATPLEAYQVLKDLNKLDCTGTDYAYAQNLWGRPNATYAPWWANEYYDSHIINGSDWHYTPKLYPDRGPLYYLTSGFKNKADAAANSLDGYYGKDYAQYDGFYVNMFNKSSVFHMIFWATSADFDVADNNVTDCGVRPAMYMRPLRNDSRVSGYLYSMDKEANYVGVSCKGPGTASGSGWYMPGEWATITATPNDNGVFKYWAVKWSDKWGVYNAETATSPTVSLQINNEFGYDISATAYYQLKGTVTFNTAGAGSGTVTCSNPTAELGQKVSVRAIPNSTSYFIGWFNKDDELVEKDSICMLTVTDEQTTYTAKFGQAKMIERICIEGVPAAHIGSTPPTDTSNLRITEGGDWFTLATGSSILTWSRLGAGNNYYSMAATDTFARYESYSCSVRITKKSGFDDYRIADNCTVLVNGRPATLSNMYSNQYAVTDKQTYANFMENTLSIQTVGSGSGTVSGSPAGYYFYNQPFTLTATPAEGSYFAGWYYGTNGSQPTVTDTPASDKANPTIKDKMMWGNLTVAARFEKEPIRTVYLQYTVPKAGNKPNHAYTGYEWSIKKYNWKQRYQKVTESITDVDMYSCNENLTIEEGRLYYVLFYMEAPGAIASDLAFETNFSVYTDQMTSYGSYVMKQIQVEPQVVKIVDNQCVIAVPFFGGQTDADSPRTFVGVNGDCTVSGGGIYATGADVTLTAMPDPEAGETFLGWYDVGQAAWDETGEVLNWGAPVSTNVEYTFTAAEDISLYARCSFTQTPGSCTITATTEGSGTVTGAGTYTEGDTVTLKATPSSGWHFVGWFPVGGGESTNNQAEVSFEAPGFDFGVVAKFEKDAPVYTVNVTASAGGTASGGGTFSPDTTITVSASAASGYHFVGWYDGATKLSDSASYQYKVTKNVTLTAKFEKDAAPEPQPDPNMCHWCGKVHEGFFQKIVGFFHNIMAKIFGAKY